MSGDLIAILAVGITLASLQWRMASLLRGSMASFRKETKAEFTTLRVEMTALRSQSKEDIGALRTELRNDISALRTEMREDIGALRTEMRDGFRQVDTRVRFLEERAFLGRRSRSASGDS